MRRLGLLPLLVLASALGCDRAQREPAAEQHTADRGTAAGPEEGGSNVEARRNVGTEEEGALAPPSVPLDPIPRPGNRTLLLLDHLADADLHSALLEGPPEGTLAFSLDDERLKSHRVEGVPAPDASGGPPARRDELWFDAPWPLATATAGVPDWLQLEDATGQRVATQSAVVFEDLEIPFHEIASFSSFPRQRDGQGFARVHVQQPTKVALPVQGLGVPVEVEITASPGPGGSSADPGDRPEIHFSFDGAEVAWLPVTTRAETRLVCRLPAFDGQRNGELEFTNVDSSSGDRTIYLYRFHVRPIDGPRVQVVGADLVRASRVRYQARPAPVDAAFRAVPGREKSARLESLLHPGECTVVGFPPVSFELRRNGGEPAKTLGTGRELRFTISTPELAVLEVKSESPSRFWLVQPAAAAVALTERLRGQETPVLSPVVRHVTVDEVARRSLLAPVGSSVRFPLTLEPRDVLRTAVALPAIGDPTTPLGEVVFRITVHQDGRSRVLHEEKLSGTQRRESWQDVVVPFPIEWVGDLELEFEVQSGSRAAGGTRKLVLAVAEPRIEPSPRPAVPNVLVYLIDTLRADHLGTYGYERRTSPRIDRLAQDAVVFEQAYSQAPWTRPSVASLFTSRLYRFHGAGKDTGLNPELSTLAETLRERGFDTAAFIANVHVHGAALNFEQGFSEFVGVERKRGESRASDVNDFVLPWIDAHRTRPFFLYVHTIDPHSTYDPPPETAGQFSAGYEGPIRADRTHAYNLRQIEDLRPEDLQHVIDLYDEEILFNDREFGKLIRHLEKADLYQNTLVVVVSDHGELFHEHGGFGHGTELWQELLHVPLIVKLPGADAPRGVRVKDPVALIDVFPTLLGLLGEALPEGSLMGSDLAPWWQGGSLPERPIFADEEPDHRCMLLGGQKVIERFFEHPKLRTLEWYDLGTDPHELHDLAAERPQEAEELQQRMVRELEELATRFHPVEGLREGSLSAEMRKALQALGYLDPRGAD